MFLVMQDLAKVNILHYICKEMNKYEANVSYVWFINAHSF